MIFEKMLTYANHLGLYAEQIGASREALGNFPQAFTLLALIKRGRQPEPRAGPLTPATASALARPRCAMVK